MPQPQPIALWGCGTMGKSLAGALAAIDAARLCAVYDLSAEAAAAVADRYGAQVAPSAEALLATPGLDGVIIAVPPYLHASTACMAAEAGIDVFLEKPMSTTVAGCRQILSAVEAHGVKLMVGQVLRYYEPYRSILRWRAEGRFGDPFAASIWRVSNGKRWAGAGGSAPVTWRASREKSGGYLLEIGAHELDMLRCLMGRPRTVYATMRKVLPYAHEMEDHIAVHVCFDGGSAVYEAGGGSAVGRYGFRIYLPGATLASDEAFDPQALQVHDMDGQLLESLRAEFSTLPGGQAEHPVQAELRGWLAALRDEAPIPIPGAEGLATVALAEAAYRSAESGQIVEYEI